MTVGSIRGGIFGGGSTFGTINLYPSTRPLHIGAQLDPNWNYYSQTVVDELTLYNRALSPKEIQAIYLAGRSGKCFAPQIITPPVSQTVVAGGNVTLAMAACGADPLGYQWTFNKQEGSHSNY